MCRITSMAIPGLALLSLLLAVPTAPARNADNGAAGSPAAPIKWAVCWVRGSDIHADQFRQPVYISGAVAFYSLADYGDVPRAFARSMANKLPAGMTSSADCLHVDSRTEALNLVKRLRTNPDLGKEEAVPWCTRANCIMTDWTNTSAASASEPPAPAAAKPGDPCYFNPHGLATAPPAGCVSPGQPAIPVPATGPPAHSLDQPPQQTAQPVPPAQDARLAQIPSRIRGMMISEVNGYESSCQGGPGPGAKSACECVARNILNYRIAHASEYRVVYDEHDLVGHVVGWQPYATFLAEAKQGCTQYSSTAAAPSASAAPVSPRQGGVSAVAVLAAPAAPQTPYAFCWGELAGLDHIVYFGVPFEAPIRNVPAWSAAYKEALRTRYKFAGVIRCPTLKSLAEAQQRMKQQEEAMRAHWKIVETGWKNE